MFSLPLLLLTSNYALDYGICGGVGHIEMLDRTNLVAVVGGGQSPKYPDRNGELWPCNRGVRGPAIEGVWPCNSGMQSGVIECSLAMLEVYFVHVLLRWDPDFACLLHVCLHVKCTLCSLLSFHLVL